MRVSRNKQNVMRIVLAFLLRHWRREAWLVAGVACSMVVATIADLFMPVFAGRMVDAVAMHTSTHRDALRAAACQEVPLLEGATHCFVSATVTRSPHHPVGRLLGDILVLTPSASGRARSRRIPFEAEHGHHVGPAHHFALLNHPEVYERLRGWLEQPGSGSPSQGLPDR